MAESFTPRGQVLAILQKLAQELEAGTLVPVGWKFRDEGTVRFKVELAAPLELPSPPASSTATPRDHCPKCSTPKPTECGRTPDSDPPTLDLLCVRCQHVWQVPQEG